MIKRWNKLAGLPLLKEHSDWHDDKHETLADRKYSDALDAEEAQPSQEETDGMFDQISDEIEEMGSAVAEQSIADMWLDENEYSYRGIYIDTRPHEGGKVKIVWPGWDEARYRGDLGW
jgi:hypothetical protein